MITVAREGLEDKYSLQLNPGEAPGLDHREEPGQEQLRDTPGRGGPSVGMGFLPLALDSRERARLPKGSWG